MPDPSIIDEVEGHYRSYLAGGDECAGCGQLWPCLTQRLVAEVQRLRAKLADTPRSEVIYPAALAEQRLVEEVQRLRKELTEARVTIRAFVPAAPSLADVVGDEIQREIDAELLLLAACRRFHPGEPCKPGQNHPAVNR